MGIEPLDCSRRLTLPVEHNPVLLDSESQATCVRLGCVILSTRQTQKT